MSRKLTEELEKEIQRIVRDEIDSRIDSGSLQGAVQVDDDREKRQVQKVRNELERKGYFLEVQVYKELQKRHWITDLNANYWDVETDSSIRPWEELQRDNRTHHLKKDVQTIDIKALKSANIESPDSFTAVDTNLVIECKHSGRQNWAFFLESGLDLIQRYDTDSIGPVGLWGSISYLDSLLLEQSYSGIDSVKHLPGCDVRDDAIEQSITIAKFNRASHHAPKQLDTAAISGVTLFGEDSLYKATQQVLNASIHRRTFHEIFMFSERAKRHTLFEFWRVYPVIIFGGPIWSFSLETGDLIVKPLQWTTFYAKRKDSEYAIDVVSLDSMKTYFDIIDAEVELMTKGGIEYEADR